MPQSIPAGLTATHVLQALADLDAGVDHPFGQPPATSLYMTGSDIRRKPSSAWRSGISIGRVLLPDEFSGGEAPGQANFVLRKLGFTVVGRADPNKIPTRRRDWTEQEVRLIVADYFAMLEAEAAWRAIQEVGASQGADAPVVRTLRWLS